MKINYDQSCNMKKRTRSLDSRLVHYIIFNNSTH
jgi:hypothetical protein